MVFISSFLAELLDEYRWGWQEMKRHAAWQKLLQMTAEAYGMRSVPMEIKSAEDIKMLLPIGSTGSCKEERHLSITVKQINLSGTGSLSVCR